MSMLKMPLWLQMNMKVFIGKMTWYLEFAFKMSQQNKMLGVVVIKNDENKWWFLSPGDEYIVVHYTVLCSQFLCIFESFYNKKILKF